MIDKNNLIHNDRDLTSLLIEIDSLTNTLQQTKNKRQKDAIAYNIHCKILYYITDYYKNKQ
jgi:hypothetical protein